MKVLIVEDSRVIRHVMRAMCMELGHEVTTAKDGLEALDRFDGHGCVLMDLHMPGLDGWDTAAILLGRAPETYVVACTSNVGGDHQAYSYTVGMQEFLPKPVDLTALREVLERAEKFHA